MIMNKTIWIINHYASYYNGRHYYIGGYLATEDFNVYIIRANTRHKTGKNIQEMEAKYKEQKINHVNFVFIKAREYGQSSIKRLFNILDFCKNSVKIMKTSNFKKPDVILASSVHPLSWFVGRRLAKHYNVPLVIETRDLWPETFVSMGSMKKKSLIARMLYRYEKYYYKIADELIFTIKGNQKYLETIGLHRETNYVNNGVDLKTFQLNMKNYKFENDQFNSDENFKVVYTGSIGKSNKIRDLLEAIKVLKNKGITNISFYFFGAGKEVESHKEFILKNNLSNVFFMGLVDNKYIPYILSKSNLNLISGFSIPLYQYGLSLNKLFDYLASGVPTLSNLDCDYDLLEEYQAGVTLKNSSPEKLAAEIYRFKAMDHETYQTYCANALRAAKDYDYRVLADQYKDILYKTMN